MLVGHKRREIFRGFQKMYRILIDRTNMDYSTRLNIFIESDLMEEEWCNRLIFLLFLS